MSRDMGLIGLLWYLPLAQFTKARPVDSFGPFSLAFPRNRYCHGSKLPATRSCAVHTTMTQRRIRVPARLFESPRHSGATDVGGTPRVLHVRIPGAYEDGRPARSAGGPRLAHFQHRCRSPRL